MGRFTTQLYVKVTDVGQYNAMISWLATNGYRQSDTGFNYTGDKSIFFDLNIDMTWKLEDSKEKAASHWTFFYFQSVVLMKPEEMQTIDFTIKGTRLPVIPNNTRVAAIHNGTYIIDNYKCDQLVSFGCRDGYILAETKDYRNDNYYLIPLSMIQELLKNSTFLGYRVPYDLYEGVVKADDVVYSLNGRNEWGIRNKKNSRHVIPKELVTKWELVYETAVLTKELTLGTSKIKVVISKGKILADTTEFNIKDIVKLFNPIAELNGSESRNYPVQLINATYKIGCSHFTLDELKLISATYNELNK